MAIADLKNMDGMVAFGMIARLRELVEIRLEGVGLAKRRLAGRRCSSQHCK
jgi:hypothetical protein